MTTKVRITNIVDDTTHSNGDVIVHLPGGPYIVPPGESVEHWLEHGELPKPLVIHERWPSGTKK